MKKAGMEAGLPAHSPGAVSALPVPWGSIPLRHAFPTFSSQTENIKRREARNFRWRDASAGLRCALGIAGWRPSEAASGFSGFRFLGGPAGDGLGPGLGAGEPLQLWLTSTGGAAGPAEAVPAQGLGDATRTLHPLRPAPSIAFSQCFS